MQQKLWAWQFKGAQTTGVGARIAQLENGGGAPVLDNKMEVEEVADPNPKETQGMREVV